MNILGGVFFACLFCFASPSSAFAKDAALQFVVPQTGIGSGDEFTVPLVLDPGGDSINAISGDITFSDDTLTLLRVTTGSSLVNLWVQSPVVSGNSVTFSGVIPGGYQSVVDPLTNTRSSGTILTLIFQAKAAGSANLVFTDAHAYQNDGLGTETKLILSPLQLAIGKKGSGQTVPSADSVLPEPFTPVVSKSDDLYSGAYALFFSTVDKDSGIDHYEVSEGRGNWVRAESPYLIHDQTLRSSIRVKAVDLAGNYRIEEISGIASLVKQTILLPGILLALLLLGIAIFSFKKFRKEKKSMPPEDDKKESYTIHE